MKVRIAWLVLLAACVAGARGQADDSRVDLDSGASEVSEAGTRERMRSDTGRQLRQAAEAAREAYAAALAAVPSIAALDREIAQTHLELDRLMLERKAVAEREAGRCRLERDAWVDARDQLLALRNNVQSDPAAVERARQRADAAQKAFRQAMVSLPAVQDLDAQLAAVRSRQSQCYIERRAMEAELADSLADARAAVTEAEKAYLDYVYGQ